MKKYLLLFSLFTAGTTFILPSTTITANAKPTAIKEQQLKINVTKINVTNNLKDKKEEQKNTKKENIKEIKKEELEDNLCALISYKKGKKEYIYKIPTSKFEEVETQIGTYGMIEDYFIPAEDIVIEEEVLVYPEPKQKKQPWENWTEEDWKNYNEFVEGVGLDENTDANWMEVFCWALGQVDVDKIYRDENGYYHYNPNYKDPDLEPKIEIKRTVIKNTTTYTYFTFKHDLNSMYDKSSTYVVPSTVLKDFLKYLDENYEMVNSIEEIPKEEINKDVKDNTCFFELGFKDEYMTKYEDVSLEKAQPAIDYINKCKENEECKIKYIKVENGKRTEKISNISKADLLKIIPMLYDETKLKIKVEPRLKIDPDQVAVPADVEIPKG